MQSIYAHAVSITAPGELLMISGQVGVRANGTLPSDLSEQCDAAMGNVEALLSAADMTAANLVKVSYFLVRSTDMKELLRLRRLRWAGGEPPAVTLLIVAGLARPEYLVEIEATAAA